MMLALKRNGGSHAPKPYPQSLAAPTVTMPLSSSYQLGDDVADLRKRIGQIWNMAADNALLDPILEPLLPMP